MQLFWALAALVFFQPPVEKKWNDYVYGITVAKDGEKWVVESSVNSQFAAGDVVVSIDGTAVKPTDDLKKMMDNAVESEKEKTRFVIKRMQDPSARKKRFDTLVLQVQPMTRLDWVLSYFEKTVDEVEGGTTYRPKNVAVSFPITLTSTVMIDRSQDISVVLIINYAAPDWIFMEQALFKLGDKSIEHALLETGRKVLGGGTVLETGVLIGENAKSIGGMAKAAAEKMAESKQWTEKMIIRVKGSEGILDHEVSESEFIGLLAAVELERLLKQKASGVK
ncbi:MAG: hypothetical protein RLZZ536_3100 [Planctomycetota bacterium]